MLTQVLALAPSNLGIDNLADKLHKLGVNVVRIGNPVRAMKSVQERTVEALLYNKK